MNIMNQNQLYFCEICDKTIKMESKSKNLISDTNEHRRTISNCCYRKKTFEPNIDDVDYILDDVFKNCRKGTFHIELLNIDVCMIFNLKIW